MNLYFDTSALIKKYIDESGSEIVDNLVIEADTILVSRITEIETISTLRRLLLEKEISEIDYKNLKIEIEKDFNSFEVIEIDFEIINKAKNMIDKYQLKSLDSIQLGTLLSIENIVDKFIVCDKKLLESSKKEGFKVFNPNE
ncbi:MAG TPA: type II toxin-antitoxin system VapC family toxin [Spirochaetota bacterium]|nr:type II toxin-antitoxin system VapC family toxin [Spirochaetota bacterium]